MRFKQFIPFLKIHVALPVFMKCGSGQHKLKVCGTKERYIIRTGITALLALIIFNISFYTVHVC